MGSTSDESTTMKHIPFDTTFHTAILIKEAALRQEAIERTYIENGVDKNGLIAFSVDYFDKKKPKKADQHICLAELMPALRQCGIKNILCCDAEYFRTLAGVVKTEPYYGYVRQCVLKGYEDMTVTLGMNHQALFYNPALVDKLKLSIDKLNTHIAGSYKELGKDILHSVSYPKSIQEISDTLDNLHQYDCLTADIETLSLSFHQAGLETISFAHSQHSGTAFCIDRDNTNEVSLEIRRLLKAFFISYTGKLVYHNCLYDMKVLCYELWMRDSTKDKPTSLLNHTGMLEGIRVLTRNYEDTKGMAYFCVNSCAGNKLGLKDLSHEYMGNYGIL